ncbi:dihydrofolate reductase [Paenibacillus sp. H1-7]|uniref:dihydrofolate reductase family protein n=1 Tax=Paenibacillus sp. H1-7 TaxID=2282849 RepID=UPI001EF79F25|nr:dihydrofolate reductase family protein [Paenibacillus sp. H1-7]ULL18350.1 dihydrofolate reductase [Paenibacillus sp. H1-7]
METIVKQRKVILYIAISMDGFIARENGDIEWLTAIEGEGDNGYGDFIQSIDTVIMGRSTYEQLGTLSDEFPYPEQTCYVFTSSAMKEDPNVEFVREDIPAFVRKLQQQEGSDIWLVGGAGLAEHFMKADLIDEYIISTVPIVLGQGIPLFKGNLPEIPFVLKEVRRYGQIAQCHYVRPASE